MVLTVKENGVRVANGSLKGTRVNGDEIRSHYENLLDELGFVLDSICNVSNATVYVHSSTEPHSASSLSVLWIEDPNRISIQRGDFVKNRVIGGGMTCMTFMNLCLRLSNL